jgi:hypothetical protein
MFSVIFEVQPKETEIDRTKAITLLEITLPDGQTAWLNNLMPGFDVSGCLSSEIFESIYNPGKFLALSAWQDLSTVYGWQNQITGQLDAEKLDCRFRTVRVIRSYGLVDRQEAPQEGKHACPGDKLASTIAIEAIRQLMEAEVKFDNLNEGVSYRQSANTRIPIFI